MLTNKRAISITTTAILLFYYYSELTVLQLDGRRYIVDIVGTQTRPITKKMDTRHQ